MRDVIERQDPSAGVIGSLVDEMDGHAPARPTSVLQQLVDEFADHAQRQRAVLQVLREQADPAVSELAAEAPGAEILA